jgi:hypothetical protein
MTLLSRRGFLAAGAATLATPLLPRQGRAQSAATALSATSRTLDIDGRAATVLGPWPARRTGLTSTPARGSGSICQRSR